MTDQYTATIGLEIFTPLEVARPKGPSGPQARARLLTGEAPDICPICLAHPGSLPTINREAVRQVLRVGLALNGKLAEYTEFDRKNYFYPDLPKGYQISQYEYPLVT